MNSVDRESWLKQTEDELAIMCMRLFNSEQRGNPDLNWYNDHFSVWERKLNLYERAHERHLKLLQKEA